MQAFAAQFSPTGGGPEPSPEHVGAAQGSMVDSDTTLPEESIARDDH
jgi:hypothetical protein